MKSSPHFFTIPKQGKRRLEALALLLPLAVLLSLCCGAAKISPVQALSALAGWNSSPQQINIIMLARLPRTLGCVLAGAALAVSGAVIQSVLANPLAAPNIIGVNAGAGLAIALCSACFPSAIRLYPAAAFVGALAAVMLVMTISERNGASRMTLVLSGIAVSGVCSALIDSVVTFVPDALSGYSGFRIGGFSNLSMARLNPAWIVIAAAIALVFTLRSELDILMHGAETAQALGLRVKACRLLLLSLAAALAGAAVSFSGLLGFVGLIVPHIMRRLIGERAAELIPACALGGALTVTLCDTAARVVFAPYELPVGIVLSLAGGPFFIWLLNRQRGGQRHA